MSPTTGRRRVAVVGGGISGLAAAWFLREHADVTLFDASGRLGGRIDSVEIAGVRVDTGADCFLGRVPWASDLCRDIGLDDLVAPATSGAQVWSRGRLRPLPDGLVLGVPSRLGRLARSGIVSPGAVARAALDLVLPASAGGPPSDDPTIAAALVPRFGWEVVERVVEPLLGGIHAGRADTLSLAANAPAVSTALAKNPSVLRALRALLRATPPSRAPVFLAPRGGVWRMVEALASALGAAPNVDVHVNTPVGALDDLDHDAVVLAAPAPAVAQLVERPAPDAANALRAIRWSSVATITFAYADSDADAAPRSLVAEPRSARFRRERTTGVGSRGTGFLVPRVEGRLITACTWLSDKWAHYARGGVALVRASCGRDGDDAVLDLADDDLAARAHAELQAAAGLRADPKEAVVIRWRNAFPQYTPGHLARIGTIASALNELPLPVEAIGAWGSGVGIAACVEQAHAATARVLERLGTGR